MSQAKMLAGSAGRPFLGAAAASKAAAAAVSTERSMRASTAFLDALFPTAMVRPVLPFPICGVGCMGCMGARAWRMSQE